jgi:hypothetical protein
MDAELLVLIDEVRAVVRRVSVVAVAGRPTLWPWPDVTEPCPNSDTLMG